MNTKRVELIIQNLQLLIEYLKLEIEETGDEKNMIKLQGLVGDSFTGYDPDYYEEN